MVANFATINSQNFSMYIVAFDVNCASPILKIYGAFAGQARESGCWRSFRKKPNLWLMFFLGHPSYNNYKVDFFVYGTTEEGGIYLDRRYLTAVAPLPNHILQVDFVSGARLLLDMNPYLDKIRFLPLNDPEVWNSAVTNGIFVRFGNVELSHDELLFMAEREH